MKNNNTPHVVAGDTDSVYVTLDAWVKKNPDKVLSDIIELADAIGEDINASFPQFMVDNCLVDAERGAIIQAGREVVGRRGLFKDVKKRYAIHVVDLEGFATDKMKIMGMEVRRSDTPKVIQNFLSDVIRAVVRDHKQYDEIYDMVTNFREEFRAMDPWRRGTPCRVSKLTVNADKIRTYKEEKDAGNVDIKKPLIHYSVTAANNTNILMKHFNENRWDVIRDGDKIEVLYLRPNEWEMKSVAIKVGEHHIPDWFRVLPFDDERHEHKLIDKKMGNVVGDTLDWSFKPITDYQEEVFEEVDFFA